MGTAIRPSILFCIPLLSCLLGGCGTTHTYKMPYEKTEAVFFDQLHLDKARTITEPLTVQVKPQGTLAKAMSADPFAVVLREYSPGKSLSLTCQRIYDIGAVGGEYIRFDLSRLDDTNTLVTVDYSDRSWLVCLPVVGFWNPGWIRERSIRKAIWGQ